MSDQPTRNGRLPQQLAQRLRIIQQEMADRPEQERQRHLGSEIEGALSRMLPEEKQDALARLEEFFPPWGEVVETGDGTCTKQQWESLPELVKQIARIVGNDPGRKQEVLQHLKDYNLPATTVPESAVRELRKALRIPDKLSVEASRLLELVTVLSLFTAPLDDFAFNAWREYARGTDIRPRTLQEAIARFLVMPDTDAGRTQSRAELDQLLKVLNQRLFVLLGAFRRFAQRHKERFAPAEIEALIGGGFGRERRAWQKYIELCGGTDREHLDAELQKSYARVLDEIWRGRAVND